MAERIADLHLRLTWDATLDTDHYSVQCGSARDFSDAAEIAATQELLFEDDGVLLEKKSYFYRVVSVNPCGDQAP